MSDQNVNADPIGSLAEEFVERFRRGERPSITEYCQRHSDLAPRIRRLFPSLVLIEQLAPNPGASHDGPLFPGHQLGRAAPEEIDGYRIIREIGRGGMGVVYEAVQESLGRHVALKILPLHVAQDEKSLERFRSEARAAARLHHTNIVPVFGVGQERGFSYIAMQFIRGRSLDSLLDELRGVRATNHPPGKPSLSSYNGSGADLRSEVLRSLLTGRFPAPEAQGAGGVSGQMPQENARHEQAGRDSDDSAPVTVARPSDAAAPSATAGGRMAPEAPTAREQRGRDRLSITDAGPRQYFRSVAQIGVQVADALHYAHMRGVIHRDIKPSNLLLDLAGVAWITDFGLAKTEDDELTNTGDLVGTVRYMAPERFREGGSPRSDIYGLGATLYELVTLRPAFAATDRAALIDEVKHADPPRPRKIDPRIPRDLETIVLKALDREPAMRFATAGQMAADLRLFLADQPIHARRAGALERAWRWCRRNPAVASLAALTLLVFLLGLSGVAWKWREAEQARQDERIARREADARALEIQQGAERLKEASALLDRGHVYIGHHRWDDADFAFTKAIELRPDQVHAWEVRADDLYARLGLWELAASDLAHAFELQEPTVISQWGHHALLRVYVGDIEGYRRVCRQIRERFGRSGTIDFSAQVVRAQALVPDTDDANTRSLADFADAIADSFPTSGPFLHLSAIANCRAGRYAEAIRRCHESIQAYGDYPAKVITYPILAIAHHRLGEPVEAQRALDWASGDIQRWTSEMYADGPLTWVTGFGATGDWPLPWWEWLECELYYREARALLGMPPVDRDPRRHVLRARSFAGLLRWQEAEEEYVAALALSPEDEKIRREWHRSRAYGHIRSKQFDLAAAEFDAASMLDPDDSDLWRFRAIAHLAARDIDEYRRICCRFLERFRVTDDRATAHDLVEACVLRPDSLPDMCELIPFGQLAAKLYPGGGRILGTVYYRAGRYGDAIQCFTDASRVHQARPADICFLAMSHQRLGHTDEARRCLAQLKKWIDEANRGEMDDLTGARPTWGGWHEKVDVPLLVAEAEALIAESAPQTQSAAGRAAD
jgi:serine/threonine protein kinase/Flp pilus assembly protein TadD